LIEKENFESQLADKEAAEEDLQKQKEEAENEVYRCVFKNVKYICCNVVKRSSFRHISLCVILCSIIWPASVLGVRPSVYHTRISPKLSEIDLTWGYYKMRIGNRGY